MEMHVRNEYLKFLSNISNKAINNFHKYFIIFSRFICIFDLFNI